MSEPVRQPEKRSHTLHGASRADGGRRAGAFPTVGTDKSGDARRLWGGFGEAWTAVSYLICGIAIWGGAGLGLDRLLGTSPILTVAGMLIGNASGVYLIYLRLMPRAPRPKRQSVEAMGRGVGKS